MIRRATSKDYELILSMVIQFANESPYAGSIDLNKIEVLVGSILDNYSHNSVIFIDDEGKGFLAGCLTPHIFLQGVIATELAWWVTPEERANGIGSELLKIFEDWAFSQGSSYVTMVSLHTDVSIEKFYEKNGYKLQEQAYFKVLN